MPQTFRLRLGDGTILMVDHGGLSTWETDPTAAVGTRDPRKWIPLKEFLIQERAAAFRRAREGDGGESPPDRTPEVSPREDGLPLVPPADAPLPAPPQEVPSLDLPDPEEQSAPVRDDSFVPDVPTPRVAPEASDESAPPESGHPAPPAPIADEIDLKPLADESMEPPPVEAPVSPIEELPVIPLRSVEEEPAPAVPDGAEAATSAQASGSGVLPLAAEPTSRPDARSRRARLSDEVSEAEEPLRLPGVVTAALQWCTVLGVILSRGLAPLTRLDKGLPLFGVDDPSSPGSLPSLSAEIVLPRPSLDLEGIRSRVSTSLEALGGRVGGWMSGIKTRVSALAADRRARGEAPTTDHSQQPSASLPAPEACAPEAPTSFTPSLPAVPALATPTPVEPVAMAAVVRALPRAEPRPRVRLAPPAARELPALRLAPLSEPRVVGDVYAGDVGGVVSPFRVWTRRFVLTAAVLAGGILAGSHWETWTPPASRMGWTLLDEISDRVRWLHLARERQEVVDQASEQLPHLARDTVALVLATNRTHVLEPPAVFEAAWGAAEKGVSTLSAGEAEELEALGQELVAALPPLDRERLRTFGRAHAQGAVFPFDARRGLQAYARGARALPPERRERLQVLLGKAIAAGLDS